MILTLTAAIQKYSTIRQISTFDKKDLAKNQPHQSKRSLNQKLPGEAELESPGNNTIN